MIPNCCSSMSRPRGVDVELRKDMWQQIAALKQRGVTIILTTHYIEEAEEMADRVGIIQGGRILMVDEKRAMMERLGTTEAVIDLAAPLAELPQDIAGYPVELTEGGTRLIYRGGNGEGGGRADVAQPGAGADPCGHRLYQPRHP